MIGTILNVAGILVGGILGLVRREPLSRGQETYFKIALGLLTVFFGLRLTLLSLSGTFLQILKQLIIVVLALSLGKLAGRLLHLQKLSNHLGSAARARIAAARPEDPDRLNIGFRTCTAVFCAAPLGLVGAVQAGLAGYPYPLTVKAVMDCLASMGFVTIFGWGALLAAIPVLVLQGTITLVCARVLAPYLSAHGLTDSVNAAGGLLVFCVGLVIFQIKKIELADYLPSLVFAPLLTWLLR